MDFQSPIDNERFLKALDLLAAKKPAEAELEFKNGLHEAEAAEDAYAKALFSTGLALFYQTQDNAVKAAKYFERAEKILPHEPQLKIMSARLLLEAFGQTEATIRRCQKIIEDPDCGPLLRHQAQNILGLAQLKLGDKELAAAALQQAAEEIFSFTMLQELDLSLLQALLKKNLAKDQAKVFLHEAIQLAERAEQLQEVEFFKRIWEALD